MARTVGLVVGVGVDCHVDAHHGTRILERAKHVIAYLIGALCTNRTK